MKLFSYDSAFSQTALRLASSCYLNVLWLICSLPLFTVGAATTALYTVTFKLVQGEDGHLTQQFFRAFRKNFRQATALWLMVLAGGVVLALDGYILYHLRASSTGTAAVIWTLLLAVILAAAVVYAIILTYVFPLTASVFNTSVAMLKNSFLIGTHYLFCTIVVFAIHFAMFFVVVRLFTPMLIFGEGLCALLSSRFLAPVISACSYEPSEDGGDAP
ncbi:MAG: YesL family protein [Oscillospiraceae bacterium]|nr:YesL family protein [Oscillospiraceae bacterium]